MDQDATGAAPQYPANRMVVLVVVLSATFMQLVDISIVNTGIPVIQKDLGASYGAIQLVLSGYQLTFAITLITAARLGDIYGRRRLFLIGMAGFTVASALCGAAPTATVLVLARLLQGLMSGLMFPQVLAVIQTIFPPRERGKAFGIYGASIGLATILGPLLGGALIQANVAGLQWRTIFLVNVPIGVVAFVAAVRQMPESRSPRPSRLDLPGTVLVAAGLGLLIYPLTAGRDKGWPVWIDVMLAASVPVLVGFVVYQLRKTRADDSPLILMTLFRERSFRVGIGVSLVFFSGLGAFFFTFTLYLQIGFGLTPLQAGLTTFPFAIGSGLASARSAKLTERLGTKILWIGASLLSLGMLAVIATLHLIGTDLRSYEIYPSLLVSGVGLGLFIAPITNVVLAGIRSEGAGSASGVLSTMQQVGGAVGVALLGVLFFSLLGANADRSSAAALPQVRQQLAAAGLSPAAVDVVAAGFQRCFSDRAHSNNPQASPPSCQPPPPRPGQPAPAPELQQRVAAVLSSAGGPGSVAQRKSFSRSEQQTLFYEVVVFALAGLLVLRLPKVDLSHGRGQQPTQPSSSAAPEQAEPVRAGA